MRVLDTERLALRWLEPGDAGFILELTNDPDWLRHIGDRGVRSLPDATRYIAEGPCAMYERLGFGLPRIAAIVSPANEDSIRLLERLGLEFQRMIVPPGAANATALYASGPAD